MTSARVAHARTTPADRCLPTPPQPIFGTNPIACGVPTTEGIMLMDQATAAFPWFGLLEAQTAGRKVGRPRPPAITRLRQPPPTTAHHQSPPPTTADHCPPLTTTHHRPTPRTTTHHRAPPRTTARHEHQSAATPLSGAFDRSHAHHPSTHLPDSGRRRVRCQRRADDRPVHGAQGCPPHV